VDVITKVGNGIVRAGTALHVPGQRGAARLAKPVQRAVWAAAVGAALLLCAPAAAVSSYQQDLEAARRSKADADRGAELFTVCAGCHGPDGAGTRNGTVPRIGGQLAAVLIKQLVDFRHARRWDPRMEPVTDAHHIGAPQAIADVAAYVAGLEIRGTTGVGDGDFLELGAQRYQRDCAQCHGPRGAGNAGRVAPRLAGQHYEYLRRQIYDAVDGRRPYFPATHIRLLARLEHDDIAGVADFLARIPAPEAATSEAEPPSR
jgi:cytochrome c553